MKYANSLKYMNAFTEAKDGNLISHRRVSELCSELGRINLGVRGVWLPSGSAGHATAVMLESVIKSAGYKVGRITATGGFDSRSSVYLDGEPASIEDYNKSVAELKNVISQKSDEDYLKEETTFVLSLLLCKIHGCEYIIFEGTTNHDYSLDSVCAPYDLIIVPPIQEDDYADAVVDLVCEAIKRGVREVISGNQRNSVYNRISSACLNSGARLSITAKPTFATQEMSSIKLTFSYAERDGYTIKSPSILLRECAMLVIESALAIRRDGIKMPWGIITAGVAAAQDTGCFDVISMSPFIVFDTAETQSELKMLLDTSDQVLGKTSGAVLCTTAYDRKGLEEKLGAFVERELSEVVICGAFEGMEEFISEKGIKNITICKNAAEAAKAIHSMSSNESMMICCGEMSFTKELKLEFLRRMGY